MKNKKAALTRGEFIIIMVLVIVAFLIVYFAVVAPTAKAVPSAFGDELCRINAGVRGLIGAGKTFIPLPLCGERRADIYADDWSQCNPRYKEDFERAGKTGLFAISGAATAEEITPKEEEQRLALKNCAAEQIAKLVIRCWYMYGEGGWNLLNVGGHYDCFRFYVYDLGEDNKISQDDVKDHINSSYLRSHLQWEKNNGHYKIDIQEKIEIKFNDRVLGIEDVVKMCFTEDC